MLPRLDYTLIEVQPLERLGLTLLVIITGCAVDVDAY